MSFIKENKPIIASITKIASQREVLSEIEGYKHAKREGLQTAKLLHWSENAITVEQIKGISCFRYFELLSSHNSTIMLQATLEHLINDVAKFQSNRHEIHLDFSAYPVKEKIEEILQIMHRINHPRIPALLKIVPLIEKKYLSYALVPFRDANPKNTLLADVTEENFSHNTISDIVHAIKHIDFRSTAELTTRYDDIISTLFHYQVPEEIRTKILNKYNINIFEEEFIITLFIRMGRFWSRRYYYFLENKDLFYKRYRYENIEFYYHEFEKIADCIISMY